MFKPKKAHTKGEIMEKKTYNPPNAPKAVGPYSIAASAGNLLFVSGQIPLNPKTNILETGTITAQTKQCLENLELILEESGSSIENVVKVGIFTTNMDKFGEINEVYSEFFTNNYPARAVVEVSALPKGVNVEIEAIAIIKLP